MSDDEFWLGLGGDDLVPMAVPGGAPQRSVISDVMISRRGDGGRTRGYSSRPRPRPRCARSWRCPA